MEPTKNSSARLTSRMLPPVRSNGYRVGNELRRTDSVSTIDSLPSPGSHTPRCNKGNRLSIGVCNHDCSDELSLGFSPSSPTKSRLHSSSGPIPPPQYIIYLEPSKGTLLSQFLMEKSQQTMKMYGSDSSHRYFPHCSLTSFFSLPTICEGKENMGHNCSPVFVGKSPEAEVDTIFKEVLVEHFACLNKFHLVSSHDGSLVPLATETGYVIAPISSELLMKEVGMLVESLGKRLKADVKLKHQWHVTLASGRSKEEQQLICAIYGNLESLLIGTEWDVVAYESQSSSLCTFDHKFREIHRMPAVAVGTK